MTGNGGLVVGVPDFRPASHCVIPTGFSGSLMFTKRAFFTRSNNLVQTVDLHQSPFTRPQWLRPWGLRPWAYDANALPTDG